MDPEEQRLSGDTLEQVRRGLRMSAPPDPVALAAERAHLAELERGPALRRWRGYLGLSGPGYLQSALTLGSGTAASSLFAGALFGYRLLWVAPLAMALGVIVLSAVAHQTLSTGLRPLEAMARYAGKPIAVGWALGALLASILWHFPQYALASSAVVDLGEVAGLSGIPPMGASLAVLAWALVMTGLYGRSLRLVRLYERALKLMVWAVVLSLAWVVARTGVDWNALLHGFIDLEIPGEQNGISGLSVVLGGLSAAVGINMVFLYPYSLLARGWGREHRGLARFDLLSGMLVPYVLATSLMIVATANTLHVGGGFTGKSLAPVDAARVLGETIGPTVGRAVLDLGLVGMALSTISLHMLCAGFVASELLGWEIGSRRYRLATLLPAPGCLAPLYWSGMAVWIAVPTSILCGFLLPLAYVGFLRLQVSRAYLGADRPRGARGGLWLAGMLLATAVLVAFLASYAWSRGWPWLQGLLA